MVGATEAIAALDLWTLFVDYTFGSFPLAIIGLVVVLFAILSLGRCSIYTVQWYMIMFLYAMTLGTFPIISIFVTIFVLIGIIYAGMRRIRN